MIPIKELKASYIKVLREAVPGMRIYSNEVEEGYETPSLFVQMIPLIFKQRETASITRSSYMFETTFLQYKKNDAEQLEIMEKIRDKLGDHLEVEDRKIFVVEPEIQFTGQAHYIIQFVFKVEFLEDCRQAAIEQMMQEVNMKEMITKGNMQH